MTNNKNLIAWVSIAAFVLSVWLIVLTLFGFGHLALDVPAGSTVLINGHTISNTSASLKLRPGTYHVTTVSARYFSVSESVHISSFRTTHFESTRKQRSPQSIAYSADGVSAAGPAPVSNTHWVGDTWVVEEVGFSTPSVLVAHYERDHWNSTYKTGDDIGAAKLPPAVIQLVNSLEESIRASLN